jgi:TrkA domain protein
MTVYEADVPGVGKKFELELDGEKRLVFIIHHDGKRDVYLRPTEDADGERLVSLNAKQARQAGSILEGAYFQPVDLEEIQVPIGESIIEWIDVPDDSTLVGKTLHECEIRQVTGTSVIAIQRGDETISNPSPEMRIEAGDILVAIGTREELGHLSTLVENDDPVGDG